MSILFGISKQQADPQMGSHLERLAHATRRYAPDGTFLGTAGTVGMGFQPYHTHEHSSLEAQPLSNNQGDMIVFDGRLDNRKHLCEQLDVENRNASDSSIVLSAFHRWGEMCFSRFVGDWALAVWFQRENALYLARDHAGTRNLYYEIAGEAITWGTYLETLLVDGCTRDLDQAYALRYLTAQPTRDSTPYLGIRSVSPAHYLKIRGQEVQQRPHWSSKTRERIHYRNDEEYADHFLSLFKQAVLRRTGPGAPILAELSGGMDSSSIVCVSDHVRNQPGASSSDLLDTVSYYDDSEPDWNETPFFIAVERQRAKQGFHIDVSRAEYGYGVPDSVYLQPGADASALSREQAFEDQIEEGNYRVILSGIGGDELLGGPPNPLPELADYAFGGRFWALWTQALSWSLVSRSPLIYTLAHTAAFIGKLYVSRFQQFHHNPPWILKSRLPSTRCLEPDDLRHVEFGHLPSALDNCVTWWNMLETLPHRFPTVLYRREYRYPYLDRDLVDYLLRVPRSRLLKPGRRRFLMRNALRGIVPVEILERKRKAFVARSLRIRFSRDRERIASLFANSALSKVNFVDVDLLRSALMGANTHQIEMWLAPMLRAVQFELWLRREDSNKTSCEFSPTSNRPSGSA
ncbi:asparagine synthetase B family protein [Acidicapsa dinghuensis]|uniref:asparagine synthase (glutamine-hydrolyzing) n=1 Tax=Acidicapsa dinghuensis TaxID=2218256 RepID=A0ABW1EEZ2_9BACT|nr:asparagine synthase-related protein [Acidicapsa dinghuensis]